MIRKEPSFSRPFDDALIKTELVSEMAREDGWHGLDECITEAPQALDILLRHAEAALRVFKRIETRENRARPPET